MLVWEVLEELPLEKRKNIHVISSDTKLETKQMTEFLRKNLRQIEQLGSHLNIKVHLVEPEIKVTFAYKVIGKGYPWPVPKVQQNSLLEKYEQVAEEYAKI